MIYLKSLQKKVLCDFLKGIRGIDLQDVMPYENEGATPPNNKVIQKILINKFKGGTKCR